MNNVDILRMAKALVRQYGVDAAWIAEMWADRFFAEGDTTAAVNWSQVAQASNLLQIQIPPHGFSN